MPTTVVGIDYSTNPRKVGLAATVFGGGEITLSEARVGGTEDGIVEFVLRQTTTGKKTLIAMDSPLGWPLGLGKGLMAHRAGQPLKLDSDLLFRRKTDHFVQCTIGQRSLDIGADRIARTARWSLGLLERLRMRLGKDIPLAWSSEFKSDVAVIEVYPAATLKTYDIRNQGYKTPRDTKERREIIWGLAHQLHLGSEV